MLGLHLNAPLEGPLRLLAIGAHADDIEIGCGGTMLRLAETYPDAEIVWVVLSGDGERGGGGAPQRRGLRGQASPRCASSSAGSATGSSRTPGRP